VDEPRRDGDGRPRAARRLHRLLGGRASADPPSPSPSAATPGDGPENGTEEVHAEAAATTTGPLLPRAPYLRIGWLGSVTPIAPPSLVSPDLAGPDLAPSTGEEAPSDVVLVAAERLEGSVLAGMLACEETATPTVVLADTLDGLASETAGCSTGVAVTSPTLAAEAAARFGDAHVAVLPPSVATGRIPSVGLSAVARRTLLDLREGDHPEHDHTALLATAGRLGIEVVPVAGDRERDPEALVEAARGAIAVIAPPHDAIVDRLRVAATLAAAGVPVLGTDLSTHPLQPVLAASGDVETVTAATPAATLERLTTSEEARRLASVRTRRAALASLSLGAWVDTILPLTGVPTPPVPSVTAIVLLRHARWLPRLAANLRRQRHPALEVVVVAGGAVLRTLADVAGSWSVPWTTIDGGDLPTLADRANVATAAAGGRYVAFLEEAGVYGPDHLGDLLLAIEATGSDAAGRAARFVHDASRDVTALVGAGAEEVTTRSVPLATAMLGRETALRFGFLRTAPSLDRPLFARLREAGGRVHSTHAYGALVPGRVRAGAHTELPGEALGAALPEGDGGVPFATAQDTSDG
jgi:hypothetical protein